MPNAGERHDNSVLVRSMDGFLIFDRTSGLNDRGYPEFCGLVYVIPEREERIGREGCTFDGQAESFRTHRRNAK